MTEYTSSPTDLTVQSTKQVIIEDYYGMSNFPIKATFDFSQVPDGLHTAFLIRILNEHKERTAPIVSNPGLLGKLFGRKKS